MLWNVEVAEHEWITLVVRADSEEQARAIAMRAVTEHLPSEIKLTPIDPDGPEGIVIEDWS